ncbi:hypothetical protein ILUMI_09706 [Ignelater luminosus]|uniref:Vacuolar protein sorting-associated protein VTA1 homolog n=1 Tax=Ignelater luminosus TaxID=2038154 RepID=A0A8K0CZG5_IGNLU|nr:hypothetical protein ILUMI_09706 [Ignelater luminosus]
MLDLPPLPPDVKHIAHFLKVADEHDERNIVVSYWSRMYACQVAMKSVPGKKPPEVTAILLAIMDWLEQAKKANTDSDGITNETAAQALIEEYAIQLFQYADAQDRAENFGKNVVKAFYTAGILMDVLQQFGNLSEDIFNKRKYAKWKAAYIHNCLKNGERPLPGPPTVLGDSDDDEEEEEGAAPGPAPKDPVSNEPSNPSISPLTPFNPPPSIPNNPPEGSMPFMPQLPTIPQSAVTPQPSPLPPQPTPAPRTNSVTPTPSAASSLGPEHIEKAQKYCKWAGSALNYDDVNTAIDNLQKALHLLQFGEEK